MMPDNLIINREISIVEQSRRYFQHKKESLKTNYIEDGRSVIRMNSTFLETADKGYQYRGMDTFTALLIILIPLIPCFLLSLKYDKYLFYISITAIPVILGILVLLTESFCYTHYPIRFNRKTKMVYIFQRNGTIISAPWDKIFFCADQFSYMTVFKQWDIRGHILADDNKTILSTFQLGYSSFVKGYTESYWEFVRRYMEEGPEAVKEAVRLLLPIADKKETFKFGFIYMVSSSVKGGVFSPLAFCTFLMDIDFSLGRWFAMKTSKIPVWPDEVNEQCKIESDDPINLSEKDNPEWSWRKGWLYKNKGIEVV